ncbi:predicted protein [Naegleria gruberi]|uniref:Predicted protein n=1 Tax=Naegleria gruberi TaxID=5762 RepID=D2VKX3_NAEGR|nr:uncharacterized protein NAEGRDRAFT_69583 [Naegleria gruberi]EFC42517.1 predicted protein [Naegleria gruberi]|eukprot:XP_002675261.1 predicted protein [Naegleria gruberi strain NEG-M]
MHLTQFPSKDLALDQNQVSSEADHLPFLRVHFSNPSSDYSDFHYFWLRHNCNHVPKSRHAKTLERIIDSSQVDLAIEPASVQVFLLKELPEHDKTFVDTFVSNDEETNPSEAVLRIEWQDGHVTEYKESFLQRYAYGRNRIEKVKVPDHDLSLIEVHYSKYATLQESIPESFVSDVLERLKRDCAVLVRGIEIDTELIIDAFSPHLSVIPTHFGRLEDLRVDNTTNQNNDQLGYTDAPVDLHTDQPFIENPPELQLLHCIIPATEGGDNYVVNSVQAAWYLKQIDPLAFKILSEFPVKFHRKQQKFESILYKPIIELSQDGKEIKQLRFSYFTYAPHVFDFDYLPEFYKAYNKFTNIVRDRKNQFYFRLEKGDFIFYNNQKMFHARTSFKGERWLKGVYFNYHE